MVASRGSETKESMTSLTALTTGRQCSGCGPTGLWVYAMLSGMMDW
jgi:hypothetical protein